MKARRGFHIQMKLCLQMVSCNVWARIKPMSSGKAVPALNHEAISIAIDSTFLRYGVLLSLKISITAGLPALGICLSTHWDLSDALSYLTFYMECWEFELRSSHLYGKYLPTEPLPSLRSDLYCQMF